MSRNRAHKKLQRAARPVSPPGGSFIYVPAQQMQSLGGQTFYGSQMKNVPVGQTGLFSPGVPLPSQPDVDPGGKPVQFRFPVSYNTFPVDRSLGRPDIPGFEQLRRLAKMYSGVTLNERYWLDLVPRMTLDIKLKKEYVDQGAETKNFQAEIKELKTFWEKPDRRRDLHTWLRKLLREQSQIDEVYLYKNRTRGRKLLGLWPVAGDQIKQLLDDWGMEPEAPDYAYQQYPWGIPGMQYSTDMMIHYQETPAADTPYGFSRVERVILEVNQALRKKRKDLANFTEGNIPQSFMEVPESLNWTPDQIDAYEQSWNALVAGQAQQQIRMKFLQPGMKYIPAEQYQMMTDFDLFILKVTCGIYGVPITEFSFTEDSNRSSGESQEDMVYRRTIGPIALSYAKIMTDVMATDFPDIHGEMFEAYFGGYEEIEDEQKKAGAITTYTGAGILGLTDAAKMANLPIDPDAPPIGRMMMTQSGPVWLDDVATPEMRKAQADATMAGYQMAANPPAPADNQKGDGEEPSQPGQKAAKSPPKNGQPSDEKVSLSRVADALAGIDEIRAILRARNVTPEEEEDRKWDATLHSPQGQRAMRILAEQVRRDVAEGNTEEGGFDGEPVMISQQGSCDCEICRGNDGKVVDELPPYHDGCDCTTVPQEFARHLPGKHDQKEHGLWAAHKHGGTHMQKFVDSLQKKAASYTAMADRRLSAKWTAEDAATAKKLAGDLRKVASELTRNPHANVATVLSDAMKQAREIHEDAPHAMSEHRLSALEKIVARWEHVRSLRRMLEDLEDDFDVTWPYEDAEDEAGRDGEPGRAIGSVTRSGAQFEDVRFAESGLDRAKAVSQEYRRWRERAISDAKAHRAQRPFVSALIPDEEYTAIWDALRTSLVPSTDDVRAIFERARERDTSFFVPAASNNGGNQVQSKSVWKLRW